jgi:hypothetical protein
MSSIFTDMSSLMTIANHILPVVLTSVAVFATWVVKVYFPQLHYIALVVEADDDAGIVKLAKYMALRNGGKNINTEQLWESFIPAAKAVSDRFHNPTM